MAGSAVQTVSSKPSPKQAGSRARLTGERPQQGVTPDSIVALHDAGYAAVVERLGPGGLVLDVGCGEGFESVRFNGEGRTVVGVDYDPVTARDARERFGARGLHLGCMDATALGLASGRFGWVCSSHLIEHFVEPERHVGEIRRVLAPDGTLFVLTPNAPADFENPFHVHLFDREELSDLLTSHFEDVWVGGLDATPRVKQDLAERRAKAAKILALDFLDLRHRVPRSWYVAVYTRLLPIAYRLLSLRNSPSAGSTRINADEFFVTDRVDETTLVLFAIASHPRRDPSTG